MNGRRTALGRSAERVNQTSTREPKKPVKLSNKFVAGLPPGQMWWDDDPRGDGLRGAKLCWRGEVLLHRLPNRRAPAAIHDRPVPALVRRGGPRAGEGTAPADRPRPRPGRQQARAPGGADDPRSDRPLHRRPPAEEVEEPRPASPTRRGCWRRSASTSASTPR